MIKSMTGYGRGEYLEENRRAVIEISAVNHRYFDANIRMPKIISFFEEEIRKYIKQYIARGKVDIYITYHSEAKEDITINVNETLCAEYVTAFRKLQKQYNLIDDISATAIAKLPDVITIEKNADDADKIWNVIKNALEKAVSSLDDMRSKEGMTLKKDLIEKAQEIDQLVIQVEERSPLVVDEYQQKIHQRIEEALQGVEIDMNRIVTEVAIFADRASIDEEITRLHSHVEQLQSILHEGSVVGRKLDFLMQEMNREVNTIGSKSSDEIITRLVINLKSEVEKIREQVQNIE